MLYKSCFFFFLVFSIIKAQTLTFSEFQQYSKGILDSSSLIQIRSILPEKFVISSADFGDFSGDSIADFAIAVRPLKTHGKQVYVYLFCDSLNNYAPVFVDTLDFFELPIEIAFNITNETCFITQKIKDKKWKFIGYTFQKNELSLVDIYETDTEQLNKRYLTGVENYRNFKDLSSMNGYFSIADITEYKKVKFFNHPVYDLKRNIYNSYASNNIIDNSWLWQGSAKSPKKYGTINFKKADGNLIIEADFDSSLISELDSNSTPVFNFYFDRNIQRRIPTTGKIPEFRTSLDDDIGSINIVFNHSKLNSQKLFGKNFNLISAGNINIEQLNQDSCSFKLAVPESIFNLNGIKETGIFVTFHFNLRNGTELILKDSDGFWDDPSSYSRLIFMNENEYYGYVYNAKFKALTEKLSTNALNVQIVRYFR